MRNPSTRPIFITLLLASLAAVYICTMPLKHGLGDALDEIAISRTLEIRRHHLLSTVWNHATLSLLPATDHPNIPLQIMMIVATIAAGYLLYTLLRKITQDNPAALSLTALFFASNGIWIHATTVETGMIPLLLLIASLRVLIVDNQTIRTGVVGMGLFALSLLFNIQQGVLFPFILWLVLKETDRERKVKTALVGTGTFVAVAIVPYLLIPLMTGTIHSIGEFAGWLTYHPNKSSLAHLSPSLQSIPRSLSGLVSLLVNTEGATSVIKLLLRGNSPSASDPALLVRLGIALILLAGLVALCLKGSKPRSSLVMICWSAIAAIWVFSFFWLGSDPQFWLPAYPFLLILAALGVSHLQSNRYRQIVLWGIGSAAVLLLGINVPQGPPSIIFPHGGKNYQRAVETANTYAPHTLVIAAAGEWAGYLQQLRPKMDYVDLTRIPATNATMFIQELGHHIDSVLGSGNRVLLEDACGPISPARTGPWEIVQSLHGLGRKELLEEFSKRYRITPVHNDEGIGLGELEPYSNQ